MSKRQFLCILGIIIIFFLWSGFPDIWRKIIAVVLGVSVVGISYNLPHEKKVNENISENI